MHGPNIHHFDFLAFAEAIYTLACAKDNFSKWLNPTVNLNNLNGVSEELWEIVPTLFILNMLNIMLIVESIYNPMSRKTIILSFKKHYKKCFPTIQFYMSLMLDLLYSWFLLFLGHVSYFSFFWITVLDFSDRFNFYKLNSSTSSILKHDSTSSILKHDTIVSWTVSRVRHHRWYIQLFLLFLPSTLLVDTVSFFCIHCTNI